MLETDRGRRLHIVTLASGRWRLLGILGACLNSWTTFNMNMGRSLDALRVGVLMWNVEGLWNAHTQPLQHELHDQMTITCLPHAETGITQKFL